MNSQFRPAWRRGKKCRKMALIPVSDGNGHKALTALIQRELTTGALDLSQVLSGTRETEIGELT